MTTFLTRTEIAELTGARTKRKQLEVLQRNGIRHYLNAAGWPVVPRSAIEQEPAPRIEETGAWSPGVLKSVA